MKQISILTILLSLFLIAGNAIALPEAGKPDFSTIDWGVTSIVKYESDLFNTLDAGSVPRVDWIVSNYAIIDANDPNYIFNFEPTLGGATEYNDSVFYFYYQVENFHSSKNVERFSIDLQDSLVVMTVSYLTTAIGGGVDIDNAPFNHNVDYAVNPEASNALKLPSAQIFTASGDRKVVWEFEGANNEITTNTSSTIVIVTCQFEPEYTLGQGMNGGSWGGFVPAPTDPDFDDVIPEPMSMILLGSAVCGLVLRKRNK
ncbi:MAG: PEP-CTERM sorting domain-containing protein [Candidatus Auribacterota bacterium]|jgi:hypothetical protein|nr:PEP-CTERM sorting domain-containing protein [Candidatus Auribacterota bacterium]